MEFTLAEVMKNKGVSQYRLAREGKLSESTIRSIRENKSRMISLDTLDSICEVLDCQPGDIIKRSEEEWK